MNTLSRLFLPDLENGNLPRALQPVAFITYLIIAVLLILFPAVMRMRELAALTAPASFGSSEVIQLVNGARAMQGLSTLTENSALDAAARDKAEDIFANQYFAHNSPAGKTPWDFIRGENYVYQAAGENLAIDFPTAWDAHASLMNSPTHRTNILGSLYTEIGVAVRQGTFQGHPSILVVQYFGKPRALAVKAPAKQKTAPPVSKSAPAPAKPAVAAPVAAAPATVSSKNSEVLGAETPAPSKSDQRPAAGSTLPSILSSGRGVKPTVQAVSVLLMFILLLAITFMLTRAGHVPVWIGLKAVFFVLLFGYLFASGGGHLYTAKITPAAISAFDANQAI